MRITLTALFPINVNGYNNNEFSIYSSTDKEKVLNYLMNERKLSKLVLMRYGVGMGFEKFQNDNKGKRHALTSPPV
jgi:hypothetical protein